MKKIISFILIFSLLISIASMGAYAKSENIVEWKDIYLSQYELNNMLSSEQNETRASGLIIKYSIAINRDGNELIIAGMTNCAVSVVKCGFKEVVIQRRANSTQDWVDYVTYEDLYDDNFGYLLSKSITVGTGYQYRVTAIHYAKKNIFSTEKINNTSNTVVFA